jgi:hypothetical protein
LKTRYAEKEDLPEVYVLYLSALKEIGEKYDEKDALDYMLSCWSKAPCILLEDNGIIGFAGLNTYSPAFCKSAVYLRDYMFYIKLSRRGIKSWRMLCKAVQATADKFNLVFVGEHRLTGTIKNHERLIRMAGAKPIAILSVYGELYE